MIFSVNIIKKIPKLVLVCVIVLIALVLSIIFESKSSNSVGSENLVGREAPPSSRNYRLESAEADIMRPVKFGDASIFLEISSTEVERELGLGKRTALADTTAMLFAFGGPDLHTIWMKDMLFSIDIFWLDKEFRVIEYRERVAPDTYPQSFVPKEPSWYVLETIAGFASKHRIKKGTQLEF